jgi:hypothetical protein
MMPASIAKEAARRVGRVGREVDSRGRHVAYWYSPPEAPQWRIFRQTAAGLLRVLRQAPLRDDHGLRLVESGR